MKVCIMKRVRLRYQRDSTLKKVVMAKGDTWPQVKAKIASAFQRLPFNNAQIIVSDAELQLNPSIPTLDDYIKKFHSGGRTVMGLCIEDDYEEYSSHDYTSSQPVSSVHSEKVRNIVLSYSSNHWQDYKNNV